MNDDDGFKRIVFTSDRHCGHVVGLTPPPWHSLNNDSDPYWQGIRVLLWNKYAEIIDRLKPIYCLVSVGDDIEGKGERSGSTELITTDRHEQGAMAAWSINYCEAEHVVMVYGTPSHTGTEEDFEGPVAKMVKNLDKIGSHEWIKIYGVTFDIKHKISGSSIPHGKGTPLARAWLWNLIWSSIKLQPKANIVIRGHVHDSYYVGKPNQWYSCVVPALQGLGTKFGGRQCEGTVDWGLTYFDVYPDGSWSVHWETPVIVEQAATALEL